MTQSIPHPRIAELEALLAEDGVPMEKLKDAFILVNKEVLRHAELVEAMGAEEIGAVTAAAKRLLNIKIETAAKKTTKTAAVKTRIKQATAKVDLAATTADDWGDAF